MHKKILSNFCCSLILIFLSIFHTVNAVYYCYEAIRALNRPLATNDCVRPLVYQPTVQLCCDQQQFAGANLQQIYDQIPAPGSPDAIPDRCERGLIFPLGATRCRAGLTLRPVGRNLLCCPADVVLPDTIGGAIFAPIAVAGTAGGAITGLRAICAPNQQRIATPSGTVCADQQTVWDPQRMCCVFTQASMIGQQQVAPGTTGIGGGGGGRVGPCVDLSVPGRASDCPSMKAFCDNELYRDLMTQQCPRTCNRCGQRSALGGAQFANVASGACVDRIGPNGRSDCPDREAYCRVPSYRTLMIQECPFTCNFCGLSAGGRLGIGIVPPPRIPSPLPIPGGLPNGGLPNGGAGGINIPPGLQVDGGVGAVNGGGNGGGLPFQPNGNNGNNGGPLLPPITTTPPEIA